DLGRRIVDLSGSPSVAELTGVLAIDRARGAAVCGLSSRATPEGAEEVAAALGVDTLLLTPLVAGEYHLNIVFAILAGHAAVVWEDGFADADAVATMLR